ncbi:MAG: ribosome silencing factor [Acidobacteria bacterium]|nr:ribosome silencing factor [Acidobacteriota bacterium]
MMTRSSRLPDAVREAVAAMVDKKALDIVLLDLREAGAFTDFFVVGSGRTTRQVQAIADAVNERLRAIGARPNHVEGYDHAEWVLIDGFDLLVHIFTVETRNVYGLERLWGNAGRIAVPETGLDSAAVEESSALGEPSTDDDDSVAGGG